MNRHSLHRTSLKGPGSKFIWTCTKCGKDNLTFADMQKEECVNPANLTNAESLQLTIGIVDSTIN